MRAVRLLFRLRFVMLTRAGGALRLLFAVSGVAAAGLRCPGMPASRRGGAGPGLRRSSVRVRVIRRAGEGERKGGEPHVSLSISSGFADSVYQVAAGNDRARPCQSSLRQFLLRGLLVPDGASRGLSGAAASGSAHPENSSGRWAWERGQVICCLAPQTGSGRRFRR